MPWKTIQVPAEVFHRIKTEHGDLVVYHAYNGGDADRILEYWFGVHGDDDRNYCLEFDIRDLPPIYKDGLDMIAMLESAYADGSLLELLRGDLSGNDWEFVYDETPSVPDLDPISNLEEQRKLAAEILRLDERTRVEERDAVADALEVSELGVHLARMVLAREEWEQKLVEASTHGDV